MLWLAFVLATHAVLGAYLATAVAGGTPVCSASGSTVVVDADGQPLPPGSHAGHEGCCTPGLALDHVPPLLALPSLHDEAPAERLSAQRLGAEWLAPLSRGPPRIS